MQKWPCDTPHALIYLLDQLYFVEYFGGVLCLHHVSEGNIAG